MAMMKLRASRPPSSSRPVGSIEHDILVVLEPVCLFYFVCPTIKRYHKKPNRLKKKIALVFIFYLKQKNKVDEGSK